MISLENRQHERVKAKSILVSLTSLTDQTQQISGFLRDISEGGLKIQKISTGRQVEAGDYECHFVLPDLGKINTRVTVLGLGEPNEKFGEMLVRMQFYDLDPEAKEKIKLYVVEQSRN